MAREIVVERQETNLFALYLKGLDASYDQGMNKRVIKWDVYLGNVFVATTGEIELENKTEQSGLATFGGLKSGREYTVICTISNIVGHDDIVEIKNVSTKAGIIDLIDDFDVVQTKPKEKKAKCTWTCTNYSEGATYTITVNGYQKASGIVQDNNNITISLDRFGDYTAVLSVESGGLTVQASCEFYLSEKDEIAINVRDTLDDLHETYNKGFWFNGSNWVDLFKVRFRRGGKAVFYSDNIYFLDTYGYLHDSDPGSGYNKGYVAKDDDSGDGMNFRIEYNVVGGRWYYLFVEKYPTDTLPDDEDASYTVHIIPPYKEKPLKWGWQQSNGTASAQQTQNAYSAILGNGYTTSFSYLVWNDMVEKVKEILDYMDEAWETYGSADYSSTKMTASDKMLTATRFNSLRFNIGSHKSTGITDKVRGNDVIGSYFTTLTNCINAWIDDL